MSRVIIVRDATLKARAHEALDEQEMPYRVRIDDRVDKRTGLQNEHFHAICGDFERSQLTWAGKRRTAAQWKVLLVSGHAVATKEQAEIVPGLEGEFVNIRESTASMSKKRGSSLIEYCIAFAVTNGVQLHGL